MEWRSHLREKVGPMRCHGSHRTLPAVAATRVITPENDEEGKRLQARARIPLSALTASLLSPRRRCRRRAAAGELN